MSEQTDTHDGTEGWDMSFANLDNLVDQAVRAERKATVAFLREDKAPIRRVDADGDTLYRSWEGPDFADAIERGEHVKGEQDEYTG